MNLQEYLGLKTDDKFNYFMNTRIESNRTPTYWVNWNNAVTNMKEHEINLNTLNFLVGKDNIRDIAKELFISQPHLLKTIPILLACRDKEINIFSFDNNKMKVRNLDFSNPDLDKIDDYLNFLDKSGLFKTLKNDISSSLVDYVFGIQVGLDSNGRKNRGGTENEKILEVNLKKLVKNTNYEYRTQAIATRIKREWGVDVPESLKDGKKGGRRYDGAIFNPNTKTVTIIETNFYGGGGSKLKAVAGEFSDMYNTSLKRASNVNFVWISDGPGWNTAKNPMREAFDAIPNIINLRMVDDGLLKEIVESN